MKVLSDALLMQPDVPVELYQEFMQDLSEEIDRENLIINDLLSLVRMDKAAAVMNVESRDINELLELILKRLRPIARKRNVEIILESIRPVTAEIDEVKLCDYLEQLDNENIIFTGELGHNLSNSLDKDYIYFKELNEAVKDCLMKDHKVIQIIYRSEYNSNKEKILKII
jgi:signal transduction histidine kinase